MLPQVAARFTRGELAVLKVVADEVRDRGSCTLTVPEIAARAGVGQTKARMAIKEASLLGLLTVEERRVPYQKNLPNLVRIISREWLAWIARGTRKEASSHSCGGGYTSLRPTDTRVSPEGRRMDPGALVKDHRLKVGIIVRGIDHEQR